MNARPSTTRMREAIALDMERGFPDGIAGALIDVLDAVDDALDAGIRAVSVTELIARITEVMETGG